MTTKSPFKGCHLQWDTAGGSSYTNMADLFGFMPPSFKRGIGESTVSDSPNDYRVHDVAGFMTGGDVQAKIRWVGSDFATLKTAFESGTLLTWKFKFPLLSGETNAANITFAGFIRELSMPEKGTGDDDPWETGFTVQTTGKPVFTASS